MKRPSKRNFARPDHELLLPASYAFLVGWVAKIWPSEMLAHAFVRTFHTKVPANFPPMGDARKGKKNFLLLALCIAGKLAGVCAFVRWFARDAQIMASPLTTSPPRRRRGVHLFT